MVAPRGWVKRSDNVIERGSTGIHIHRKLSGKFGSAQEVRWGVSWCYGEQVLRYREATTLKRAKKLALAWSDELFTFGVFE